MSLCKGSRGESSKRSKPESSEVPTYQQLIISQAKSLGKLRRHYVVRKCFEDKIDENKALGEIAKYKSCCPKASEVEILEQLLNSGASPDTIIYQTYVVEAQKGKCAGADETFRKLMAGSKFAGKKGQLKEPLPSTSSGGSSLWGTPMPKVLSPGQICVPSQPGQQSSMAQQPLTPHSSMRMPSPQRVPSPRSPRKAVRFLDEQRPCFPCTPPCSEGPRPNTPHPPCPQQSPSYAGSGTPKFITSTPDQQDTSGFFASPMTPVTVRTKIPVGVRQELTRTKKVLSRDMTGSRIPFPVASRDAMRKKFTRRDPRSEPAPAIKRRISFGDTQVSYFEDTMPSLLGVQPLADSTQPSSFERSGSDAAKPNQVFTEYKSMIDEEKKEIREMHHVVTKLMDRPERVDFRDMYTLVPSISYTDETLTDTTAPEVVAAMLHSDELGLNMKSPPTEVYNTLFRGGEKDRTVIMVSQEQDDKSVVPVSSEGFEASLLGYEQKGLFEDLPHDVEYTMPEMPRPRKQKDEEQKEEDPLSSTRNEAEITSDVTRLSNIHPDETLPFNVQLQPDLQCEHDFLQIRGSQPPPWFPGYFVAMGDNVKINVVRKPWSVFEKAWRKFMPSNMKPDKGTYVLGI